MVQKTLEGIPGLSDISVDLEGKKAAFATSDQDLVRTAVDAVTKAGYPASKA